jgi:hypothetical protein
LAGSSAKPFSGVLGGALSFRKEARNWWNSTDGNFITDAAIAIGDAQWYPQLL